MLEKNSLSDQRIIDILSCYYEINTVSLTHLPLGADLLASVYKADVKDNSSYFVKLKHGHHHHNSSVILNLLQHAGIQNIIPPVKSIHGQSIQLIEDYSLIVYPFIEGQNGFSHPLTKKQWILLGSTLRQVHEIDVPVEIQQQLRRETYSCQWRERAKSLCTLIENNLNGDNTAFQLLAFMRKNKLSIHRLIDRAEQLAQQLENETHKFVLCHSDIHAGNVLINENIYIIDWDDPIMAPKERDLMFIGGGVANVWNKPDEESLFYQGYGNAEINNLLLAYYRHERIVEDIVIYAQTLLLTSEGGKDRPIMYKHFIDMFEPRGVVEIAFETDTR